MVGLLCFEGNNNLENKKVGPLGNHDHDVQIGGHTSIDNVFVQQ